MYNMVQENIINGFNLTLKFEGGQYKASLLYIPHLKANVKGYYGVGKTVAEALADCEKKVSDATKITEGSLYPSIDKFLLCRENILLVERIDVKGQNRIMGSVKVDGITTYSISSKNLLTVLSNLDNAILREELTAEIEETMESSVKKEA